MNYSQNDSIISEWVNRHKFTLFTSIEGIENSDYRAVYLSSEQGECCQIWIDKPDSGIVCVHAADVETHQDEELSKEWCVSEEKLCETLDNAVSFVNQWFARKSA